MEEIISRFDEVAENYDSFKEKIPHYRIMVNVIREILSYYHSKNPPETVCELGMGAGEFAHEIVNDFEPHYFVGVDGSPKMVEQARDRLENSNSDTDLNLINETFAQWNPTEQFDWIYSSLAIHHLQDEAKRKLFKTIYNALTDDGLFVLCDLVKRPDEFMDLFKHVRKERMLEAGFTEQEFQERWQMHVQNDVPADLSDMLGWLNDIGFTSVDCIWKDWNRSVVVAKR